MHKTVASFEQKYSDYGKKLFPTLIEVFIKRTKLDHDELGLILYFVYEGISKGNLNHIFRNEHPSKDVVTREFFEEIRLKTDETEKIINGVSHFVAMLQTNIMSIQKGGGIYQVKISDTYTPVNSGKNGSAGCLSTFLVICFFVILISIFL